jgi:hypothetical protein
VIGFKHGVPGSSRRARQGECRSGQNPSSSFALTGSSTTFDRLVRRQVRFVDDPGAASGFDPADAGSRGANFAKLIADGRRLFLYETFAGNGRPIRLASALLARLCNTSSCPIACGRPCDPRHRA